MPRWIEVSRRPSEVGIGTGPTRGRWATSPTTVIPLQPASSASAHAGTSWSSRTIGLVGGREPDHLLEVRTPARRGRVPVKQVPAADQHRGTTVRPPCASSSPTPHRSRRSTTTSSRRRSPARASRSSSSPRASASARRRRAAGYVRTRGLLPADVAALPALAATDPVQGDRASVRDGPPRRRCRRDLLHVQWLAAPPVDNALFRPRGPAVFTAHDLLPRRTARREQLWRRLLARFDARRRAQLPRRRPARRARRAAGTPAGDPPPRLPERSAAVRRRPHAPLPRR